VTLSFTTQCRFSPALQTIVVCRLRTILEPGRPQETMAYPTKVNRNVVCQLAFPAIGVGRCGLTEGTQHEAQPGDSYHVPRVEQNDAETCLLAFPAIGVGRCGCMEGARRKRRSH
jgi:hypothetical protein